MIPWILAGGFIILIIIGIIAAAKQEKKRREFFAQLAARLNMTYYDHTPDHIRHKLADFEHLAHGRKREVNNLLTADNENLDAFIFDYRYTTGSGKNQSTVRFTVLYYESPHLKLPHFTLAPEYFIHRIGDLFGKGDIDFDMYPEFSKKYLLKGDDEEHIRRIFDRELITFLNERDKISIEGKDQRLIIFEPRRRQKTEDIEGFFKEGIMIAQKFMGK